MSPIRLPNFSVPLPSIANLKNIKVSATAVAESNFASRFYKHLGEMIQEFDTGLDAEHEVGASLASFGSTLTIHITQLGYQNPSLIVFFGKTDDGNDVQLIQHVNQISVLLVSLPKLDPSKPKRRFGFTPPDDEQIAGQEAT